MKIDRIDIYHVAMPLIYPWRTAYGEDASIESVLLRMTGDGKSGWGESAPMAAPFYSPEWASGTFTVIRDWLAPRIIGQQIDSGIDLQASLSMFKGNQFAKSALDTAWWDLDAKLHHAALYRHLGGKRNVIDVGADFGVMDSVEELLPLVADAVASGFKRVKLKFRPGWDINMLEAVRSTFPGITMHIDCNSGYRLDDLALFKKLDRFNLAMIEQPLMHDDLVDHAKLARAIETPICLDESITSIDRARQAIELGSCHWINIKPGRVGGLTNARSIHDLCQEAGIPCWVGSMLESAIGACSCIALATLANFKYPADIFPSRRFYREDLADPPITLDESSRAGPCVTAPEIPGISAEPVSDRLEGCCVQSATIC